MEFKNTIVAGIPQAIQAIRLSYNSGDRSDSEYDTIVGELGSDEQIASGLARSFEKNEEYDNEVAYKRWYLGDADKALAQKLISAGSEQRKFLRQIFVAVDITAPAYWWAQFDTYKVGVTRMSSSFMHYDMTRDFEASDFEVGSCFVQKTLDYILGQLNTTRKMIATGAIEKNAGLHVLRQILPQGYKYTSHVTMNYENVLNMVRQRKNCKLKEWSRDFMEWVADLPYAKELLLV